MKRGLYGEQEEQSAGGVIDFPYLLVFLLLILYFLLIFIILLSFIDRNFTEPRHLMVNHKHSDYRPLPLFPSNLSNFFQISID